MIGSMPNRDRFECQTVIGDECQIMIDSNAKLRSIQMPFCTLPLMKMQVPLLLVTVLPLPPHSVTSRQHSM